MKPKQPEHVLDVDQVAPDFVVVVPQGSKSYVAGELTYATAWTDDRNEARLVSADQLEDLLRQQP